MIVRPVSVDRSRWTTRDVLPWNIPYRHPLVSRPVTCPKDFEDLFFARGTQVEDLSPVAAELVTLFDQLTSAQLQRAAIQHVRALVEMQNTAND